MCSTAYALPQHNHKSIALSEKFLFNQKLYAKMGDVNEWPKSPIVLGHAYTHKLSKAARSGSVLQWYVQREYK